MSELFNRIASAISHASGRPVTFILAVLFVLAWAACGPFFDYSENWQLVINTSTTIITFLMVFLLQNTQDRDTTALHAKLDELVRSSAADDRFIGIEHLSTEELTSIREMCERAVSRAKEEGRAEERAASKSS